MTKQFELLATGGDMESIKAAIVAGADAVYCGLSHFNARNRATNIEIGDLNQVLHLAHAHAHAVQGIFDHQHSYHQK